MLHERKLVVPPHLESVDMIITFHFEMFSVPPVRTSSCLKIAKHKNLQATLLPYVRYVQKALTTPFI